MLSYMACAILEPLFAIFKVFKIEGEENIPRKGPVIIVLNHKDIFDPWKVSPLLHLNLSIYWFSKKELYSARDIRNEYADKIKIPGVAWIVAFFIKFIVTYSLTIPVDRENSGSRINRLAIKKAGEVLSKGKAIGIFGEGGLGREGEVRPIFVGLAKKYRAPILPVKIEKGRLVFGQLVFVNDKDDNLETAKKILDSIYNL